MSGVNQQDADGVWRQAIPLPFYKWRWWGIGGLRYVCGKCFHPFTSEQAYRDHYRSDHPEKDAK